MWLRAIKQSTLKPSLYVFITLHPGKLVFTMEDDCTYVFDLDTPLACIENSDGTICQVENQGHLYDLNDLVITKDMDKGIVFSS